MDENTVIELAKQAGFLPDVGIPVHPSNLFKFATLVSAHEREECAKVCELVAREIDDTNGTATYIAAAIRSRT